VYTDIPELTRVASLEDNQNLENGFTKENKENQIVMVYSGHLSKDYRSPTKLISLIKAMSETINISCLFFSRGDCEDELRQAEIDTNGIIKRMGYVSQEELSKYTHKADFLLDIGNRLSGEDYSLPSKVICYMAMGKPIIHINGVNDSAIKYLEKYGLAINISEESDIKDAAKQTIKFINSNRGKIIPFDEVAEKFPQNTPEYTAELIISQIQNRLK
jgi:glycosyltransferase involved in cell wall biosynthesis